MKKPATGGFLRAYREEMDRQWLAYARDDLREIRNPGKWSCMCKPISDAEAEAHLPELLKRLGLP